MDATPWARTRRRPALECSERCIVPRLPATGLHRNDWQIVARDLGAARVEAAELRDEAVPDCLDAETAGDVVS